VTAIEAACTRGESLRCERIRPRGELDRIGACTAAWKADLAALRGSQLASAPFRALRHSGERVPAETPKCSFAWNAIANRSLPLSTDAEARREPIARRRMPARPSQERTERVSACSLSQGEHYSGPSLQRTAHGVTCCAVRARRLLRLLEEQTRPAGPPLRAATGSSGRSSAPGARHAIARRAPSAMNSSTRKNPSLSSRPTT
jgi:hypothetical protein